MQQVVVDDDQRGEVGLREGWGDGARSPPLPTDDADADAQFVSVAPLQADDLERRSACLLRE